jgi:hypothetical protein
MLEYFDQLTFERGKSLLCQAAYHAAATNDPLVLPVAEPLTDDGATSLALGLDKEQWGADQASGSAKKNKKKIKNMSSQEKKGRKSDGEWEKVLT